MLFVSRFGLQSYYIAGPTPVLRRGVRGKR
jgi:hypothetical protein